MSYCVKAYGCRLFDLRADALLRSGRKTGVIRPSCSWCTALEPLVGNYQTFVQIAYCVRVYGCRLSDLRARNAARKQVVAHVWSATQPQTLQTRDKLPTFGALNQTKPSKRETNYPCLERHTTPNPPNTRKIPRIWSAKPATTLQTREKLRAFGAAAITQALGYRDEPPDAHTAAPATPQARRSCAP